LKKALLNVQQRFFMVRLRKKRGRNFEKRKKRVNEQTMVFPFLQD